MKRLCAGLLVLLFLVPAVFAHDDEVFLRDFFFNSNDSDDVISAISDASKVDYSCVLEIVLKQLCDFSLTETYSFQLDASFNILTLRDAPIFCMRYFALPDGRAPPAKAVSL